MFAMRCACINVILKPSTLNCTLAKVTQNQGYMLCEVKLQILYELACMVMHCRGSVGKSPGSLRKNRQIQAESKCKRLKKSHSEKKPKHQIFKKKKNKGK